MLGASVHATVERHHYWLHIPLQAIPEARQGFAEAATGLFHSLVIGMAVERNVVPTVSSHPRGHQPEQISDRPERDRSLCPERGTAVPRSGCRLLLACGSTTRGASPLQDDPRLADLVLHRRRRCATDHVTPLHRRSEVQHLDDVLTKMWRDVVILLN